MGQRSTEINLNNSFLNKVTAERRALVIVNARFVGVRQLAGLSSAAIRNWQAKVSASGSDRVVAALLVLGEICQSLSNRSNESFTPLNPDIENRLESAMSELRIAISEVPQ